MPAGILACIVSNAIYHRGEFANLEKIVRHAMAVNCRAPIDYENQYIRTMELLLEDAMTLSKNNKSDTENIKKLGVG